MEEELIVTDKQISDKHNENFVDMIQDNFLLNISLEKVYVEKADTKEFFANPKSERTKLFLSQIL